METSLNSLSSLENALQAVSDLSPETACRIETAFLEKRLSLFYLSGYENSH